MAAAPEELAVRLRRATFNRALAEGDLVSVSTVLAPEVVMITGTDSAVLSGRKAQLQAWKREFAAPPPQRNLYVRRPDQVSVSAVEPIALELGTWTCTVGETPTAFGSYAAKWRNTRVGWVIEAEVFVTLG